MMHSTPAAILVLALVCPALAADPPPAPEGYEWVPNPRFTDEFEGDALDATKWHDHHPRWKGRPPPKFMPSAISLEKGMLLIRNSMLDEPQGP